ncbi:MAG: hypothetical protein NTY81_03070 [Candidatus Staskawiczbacteria bacterium]|nr:hypothetical protein [Candidatus Staskawiczbacteria bacterium]
MPRNPEEINFEESRAESDEELIRGGAKNKVDQEGERHLDTTDEQKEKARQEMLLELVHKNKLNKSEVKEVENEKIKKRKEILLDMLSMGKKYHAPDSTFTKEKQSDEAKEKMPGLVKEVKDYFSNYYANDIKNDPEMDGFNYEKIRKDDKQILDELLDNIGTVMDFVPKKFSNKVNYAAVPLAPHTPMAVGHEAYHGMKENEKTVLELATYSMVQELNYFGGLWYNDEFSDINRGQVDYLFGELLENHDKHPKSFDGVAKVMLDRMFCSMVDVGPTEDGEGKNYWQKINSSTGSHAFMKTNDIIESLGGYSHDIRKSRGRYTPSDGASSVEDLQYKIGSEIRKD